MRKVLIVLLMGIVTVFGATVAAQDDMSEMAMEVTGVTVLGSVDADGTPEDAWLDAWAFAVAAAGEEEGSLDLTVYANNLVPEGVYTLWGVNMNLVGMDVFAAGGPEANAFTAGEAGSAVANVIIPAGEEYEMLALAYHSDGQTYGDNPGAMGEVTFTHVMGAFPGMQESETVLSLLPVVQPDGVPEMVGEEAWAEAAVIAVAEEVEDAFEITVYGANLVVDGLYTTWAVNEGTFGMQVAPAGGLPDNEFRANEAGFGINEIVIAADEVPDALALAYHSDDQTYGDNPGPMGDTSFTHVMGMFPAAE